MEEPGSDFVSQTHRLYHLCHTYGRVLAGLQAHWTKAGTQEGDIPCAGAEAAKQPAEDPTALVDEAAAGQASQVAAGPASQEAAGLAEIAHPAA